MSPLTKILPAATALLLAIDFANAQTTQDIKQLFGINKIVPDLLPAFDPVLLLEVSYNGIPLLPGQISSQNG